MARLTNLELTQRLAAANNELVALRHEVSQARADLARKDAALGAAQHQAHVATRYVAHSVRSDTLRRISIKYACAVRFNSDLGIYEAKRDGSWTPASQE